MAKITQLEAREILDSRGNPTVEVTVVIDDSIKATAAVPSGASVGGYEAVELRDNDPKHYGGKGVLTAIRNINELIAPLVINKEVTAQQEIDHLLIDGDATPNKSKLGANATLGVSMAVAKAGAASLGLPVYRYLHENVLREPQPLKVPTPIFNVINGGKHAGQNVDLQEFIIVPASYKTYQQSLELGVGVYKGLQALLKQNNMSTLLGDEGGFAPTLTTNEEPLSLLSQAIEKSGFRLGYDVFCGIDAAANSFYTNEQYKLKGTANSLSSNEMITFYQGLMTKYHILYLEDGLAEDDWEGWTQLYQKFAKETLIVGDDLTATNPLRLEQALAKKAINGIIIKPNQIGTVIETLAVVEMAKAAGIKVIVSHRSGETNDDFVADLAVAAAADYAKFGAPARGERVAKYNRLSQIDSELNTVQK